MKFLLKLPAPLISAWAFLYNSAVYAATTGLPPKKTTINIGFIELPTDPAALAGKLLEFGFGLGALFAILLLIIGGYEVLTSAGNPDQLEAAKKRITAAITGLIFLLATGLILRTMGGLIGIDFFK